MGKREIIIKIFSCYLCTSSLVYLLYSNV